MKVTTFAGACREFFGLKEKQSLAEFVAELKTLNPDDRKEMIEMFKTVDLEVK
jgi:hypothetical protein